MNDEVTIEAIEKFVWDATGYKADQTQVDALKVLIETRVARQAALLAKAPQELTVTHLEILETLARQLLDTGGRMLLHREGQLDVQENPVATRRDLDAMTRQLTSMRDTLSSLGLGDRLDALRDQVSAIAARADMDEPPLPYMAFHRPAVEPTPSAQANSPTAKPITQASRQTPNRRAEAKNLADETKTRTKASVVTPVLDDETRDAIREVLKPKRVITQLNADGTLTCNNCGRAQPTTEFYKNAKAPTGFEPKCRTCRPPRKVRASRKAAA